MEDERDGTEKADAARLTGPTGLTDPSLRPSIAQAAGE